MSGLSDPNHSIVLRALLDREKAQFLQSQLFYRSTDNLSASAQAYPFAQENLEAIAEEAKLKFIEFREKWRKRLAFVQLHPFLHRNQWFVSQTDGFVLMGKGTKKDSKMLYLQSLHDMASDGERQVSLVSGQIFRLQPEIATLWHRDSVQDDRSRLLPVLEEAMRMGEQELCKKVRLFLSDLALETFTEQVVKWDKRIFASEEELFRGIAWPWYHSTYVSGFQGFMETFANLCEAVTGTILDHYTRKWDLFLRGLATNGNDIQSGYLPQNISPTNSSNLLTHASENSSGENLHV